MSKNRYEGLLVLDTQGREDTVKDVIERLEKDFKKEGADIEQVQKMDRRQFAYTAGKLDSGYYVNFVFHGERVSFRPAHSLAAHRPLGSLMRARLKTYPALAAFRQGRNGARPAEPTALDKLRAKFKLDPEVYRQHFQKLRPKKAAKEA